MEHTSPPPTPPLDLLQMIPELPWEQMNTRLRGALRLGDAGQRSLAFYLTEMEERELYGKSGHSTTVAYAEAVLDMDRRRVMELIRVGRQLLELREIDKAFCAGELSWSRILLLARVATPAYEEEWLATAKQGSVRELAATVRSSKPGRGPAKRTKGLKETRFTRKVVLDKVVDDLVTEAIEKLSAERGERISEAHFLRVVSELVLSTRDDGSTPGRQAVDDSLYRVVLHETRTECGSCATQATDLTLEDAAGAVVVDEGLAAAIRCDATCTHANDDHAHRDRKTPDSLRRRVRTRDGNRCRCCGSRDSLMVHHIQFLSEGGRTTAWNLITLCGRCHSLVHEGLIVIEGARAEDAVFRNRSGEELGVVGVVEVVPLQVPDPAECSAAPAVVTLDTVPARVDGDWWRAHAHLVSCRGDGGLSFRAGRPAAASAERSADPTSESACRPDPQAFGRLAGQADRITRLQRFAAGARSRGTAFPHTLFEGPPGTGKTTLANALAACVGARCIEVAGPLLTTTRELVRILTELREDDFLFIDEIHAVPQGVLEVLYQAMADDALSLVLHEGMRSRSLRLALPRFSLLAATTDVGALEPALRSRFGLRESLGFYGKDELNDIAVAAGRSAGFRIKRSAARRLAQMARGTPRELLRLTNRALDAAAGRSATVVRREDVDWVLAQLGYDGNGMLPEERRYLGVLSESGEPVPLGRLARLLGASANTLTRYIEPWLFRRGYVRTTARGRQLIRRPRLVTAGGC